MQIAHCLVDFCPGMGYIPDTSECEVLKSAAGIQSGLFDDSAGGFFMSSDLPSRPQ
jgi:hypothetical protein